MRKNTNNQETKMTEAGPLLEAAVIYARVSSTGQLGRDGDEDGDGYSIPAQVKACEAEAKSRGAKVVQVYIDRAESARSDDRPVLQQMLRELPEMSVKYVIVHKVDRLARNRLDDATLYQAFVGMGITLVSATENIDETPAGRLMHGMLATFAEYYSNNLATEIKKGLLQKLATGGTPYKPPIGYLPKRELIGNQDIRTVITDPERAPFITRTFKLYATGRWTLIRLAAYLEDEGLSSRPTPRWPSRPLGDNDLHRILTNPYYKGVVEFAGHRNPNGRHERLTDPDTWDQVQVILAAHRVAGDRPSVHLHYLRGKVVCAECQGRLLYGRHRGRSRHYEYFGCINRATRRRKISCSSGHYNVSDVEEKVAELWATLHLSAEIKDDIRRELTEYLEERAATVEREAQRHRQTIEQLKANQEKLVQMYYQDLVDEEVLRTEQARLKQERAAAERLLAASEAFTVDLHARLEEALARIDRPHESFLEADPPLRRVMNAAVYVRIEVRPDGDLADATLTPTYQAISAWQSGFGRPARTQPSQKRPPRPSVARVRPFSGSVHLTKPLLTGLLRKARRRRALLVVGGRRRAMCARRWSARPEG
jgi:site-specific DNA recombinase